jgi:CHASE3 domain sensor protein
MDRRIENPPLLQKKGLVNFLQTVLVVIPLLLMGVVGWLSSQTTRRVQESFTWVTRAYEVMNLFERISGNLAEIETTTRNYVLTGSESYLELVQTATTNAGVNMAELRVLASEDSANRDSIAKLATSVQNLLETFRERVHLRQTAPLDSESGTKLEIRASAELNEVRSALSKLTHAEELELVGRQGFVKERVVLYSGLIDLFLAGSVITSGAAILLGIRVRRLRRLVTICAWTHRLKMDGEWVTMEEFLRTRFNVSVSHGISEEGAQRLRNEIQDLRSESE